MKYIFSSRAATKEYTPVVLSADSDMLVQKDGRMSISLSTGKREEMTRRKLISLVRRVVSSAKAAKVKKIAINFADFSFPHVVISKEELAELMAVNLEMANFEFTKYKSKPKEGWSTLTECVIVMKGDKEVEAAWKKGKAIGEEVNATRTLASTPGGDMTPSLLADAAREASANLPIDVKVLDEMDMEELGMGAILGVGKGSDDAPRFIVMEYMGGEPDEQPIVLVGKGVTFDTGGLNLKPSNAIYEMHMDMSGGAAVIHSIVLAARLKLKKNVVALIPAAENMVSGSSYHPGDVLKGMSGKTIEILNTDAEGRVILSDALTYAKRYKPRLVVDVATLTGAAVVALGQRASAIFTRDAELENRFRALGEATGDYVWPLPLWDEYEAEIKGTFGDWANLGKNSYGGAITGAMFLYQFAKDYPWVHIDMVPRMTSTDGDYLARGAAGEPVRLLLRLLETF